jgi:hypothetical protein
MNCYRIVLVFLLALGCNALGCVSLDVRRSAIAWNVNTQQRCYARLRVLELASKDASELARMMDCCPSPNVEGLVGTWRGVNKGLGPAAAGLHQDVKVFTRCGGHIEGHNILVQQVKVEELASTGWKPKQSLFGQPLPPVGHFLVTAEPSRSNTRGNVVLDYDQPANRIVDPTRYLLDELVEIEPNLLLGRAYVTMGTARMPVAYFALEREAIECDILIEQSQE